MASVRWTEEAARWLEEIYNYIAQDNPEAAARVVGTIYRKVQILAEFPEIGYKYAARPEGEIRVIFYGHYRIPYLIREAGAVEILGVFHGGLPMDRYL